MSAPSAMRWRVESWDPGYGASTEDQAELGRSDARVTPDVEVPEARWRAIDPDPKAAGWAAVLFVDGVRRIDAMAWISEPDGGADGVAADGSETGAAADGAGSGAVALALCASYAAGVVRCRPGGADLVAAEVRRGLFSTAEHATDVVTTAGRYQRVHTAQRGEPVADLSLAVQRALGDVEAVVAATARNAVAGSNGTNCSDDGDDLLVLDGPLRGRQHLPRVLGFIKTHRS
ncbi:MAG: hypothetical protein QOF38_1992, partial [Pseudonocardiales bacterium]|nr:hypothetical protein [Pseudonocardiales bacterium]